MSGHQKTLILSLLKWELLLLSGVGLVFLIAYILGSVLSLKGLATTVGIFGFFAVSYYAMYKCIEEAENLERMRRKENSDPYLVAARKEVDAEFSDFRRNG